MKPTDPARESQVMVTEDELGEALTDGWYICGGFPLTVVPLSKSFVAGP
jgi:hypothetical protein